MADLRCFTDDCDAVIAESVADALEVLNEHQGVSVECLDPELWGEVEDSAEITIHCDATGEPSTPGDPGVGPVTRTAGEWARLRGRGFLCTAEW